MQLHVHMQAADRFACVRIAMHLPYALQYSKISWRFVVYTGLYHLPPGRQSGQCPGSSLTVKMFSWYTCSTAMRCVSKSPPEACCKGAHHTTKWAGTMAALRRGPIMSSTRKGKQTQSSKHDVNA